MASSDDIEHAMRSKIAADEQHRVAAAQDMARRTAAGAQAAQGFIDLMTRNRVATETIYRHQQVRISRGSLLRSPRPDKIIERYEPVDRGWVVTYAISEYGDPWLISYLRPDGLLVSCDVGYNHPDHVIEGVLAPPARTALQQRILVRKNSEPTNPYLSVDQYATAARWYLD